MSQPSRGQNSSTAPGALAATGDGTAPRVCCQAGLRLRESPGLMQTPSTLLSQDKVLQPSRGLGTSAAPWAFLPAP